MRIPKTINYPDMKVIMRKDFYDGFQEQLKKIELETGATYFGHNIIKNYRNKDHKISTFCNYEEWHELYWDKYRNFDPLEKTVHQAVQKNNFAVLSWEMGNISSSSCSQERMKLTQIKDGICFSFKRPESYVETMMLGWDTLDPEKLNIDYISCLCTLLKPIRDYHWEVHDKI